ncbi:MAG: hypothetical protein AABZ32_03505, partial [Bacteroidota bacterium]
LLGRMSLRKGTMPNKRGDVRVLGQYIGRKGNVCPYTTDRVGDVFLALVLGNKKSPLRFFGEDF